MIALSQERNKNANLGNVALEFHLLDFEKPFPFEPFDAAICYDALHHAEDEAVMVQRVYGALKPAGIFIMIEPGEGHSKADYSIQAMQKYGTTEKDMPYPHLEPLLKRAGFRQVSQHLRIGLLALLDLASKDNHDLQVREFTVLCWNTTKLGLSSLIIAQK